MAISRRLFRITSAVTLLAACASFTIFADGRVPQACGAREFKCYCQCEGQDGMASCPKKMCELPKYEDRWWATSCHKRMPAPSTSNKPPLQPYGRPTRGILNAGAGHVSPSAPHD